MFMLVIKYLRRTKIILKTFYQMVLQLWQAVLSLVGCSWPWLRELASSSLASPRNSSSLLHQEKWPILQFLDHHSPFPWIKTLIISKLVFWGKNYHPYKRKNILHILWAMWLKTRRFILNYVLLSTHNIALEMWLYSFNTMRL